jgi:hypothetical protein
VLVVGCFGQVEIPKGPEFTNGLQNGLYWRGMGTEGKLAYVNGIIDGISIFSRRTNGPAFGYLPTCPTAVDTSKWYPHGSYGDLTHKVDLFYESGANIPLPMMVAVMHTIMKMNGATDEELRRFRDLSVGVWLKAK